jgi:hypothetical protein
MNNIILIVLVLLILIIILFCIKYDCKFDENIKIIYNPNNNKRKYLMVVAHPDDEILWGYRHIYKNPEEWKIICMTCADNNKRVNDFKNVMKKINITNYEIWNNKDSLFALYYNDKCKQNMIKELLNNNYEKILTHNNFGEYGNLQHIGVHKLMKNICNKYKFNINYFKRSLYFYPEEKKEILKYYNSEKYIIKSLYFLHTYY